MRVVFHKASLRLALLYLAVITAISIFFSATIYQQSLHELDRGLRQVAISADGPIVGGIPELFRERLEIVQEQNYNEAKQRIAARLVMINLTILIGGGFLSYYLARRTLRPIEEAHDALERFTADASHELRTPIAAMQTEIEVALLDGKLTAKEARELLQSNLEELGKLTALSDGLLRLAHHGQALEKSEVAVRSIVDDAVSRMLKAAEQKHILIVPDIEESLTMFADRPSLTEALVTLLDNAVKYSPEKSEIRILVRKDQRHVVIEVADQGIGIKASELPHVFERFYRADSSRSKQQHSGYGLGLALARDIVERHGGTVTAVSTPGKGATFTVRLPR